MSIHFICEKCEQPLEIDDQGAGLEIECPSCHSTLIVPDLDTRDPIEVAHERLTQAVQHLDKLSSAYDANSTVNLRKLETIAALKKLCRDAVKHLETRVNAKGEPVMSHQVAAKIQDHIQYADHHGSFLKLHEGVNEESRLRIIDVRRLMFEAARKLLS